MLRSLKKNKTNNSSARTIELLPTDAYKNVIVIVDDIDTIDTQIISQLFRKAVFTFLYLRNEKTDNSANLLYTLHDSDFRLGILKNERLKDLTGQKFDLLVSISQHKKLNQFSQNIHSNLKVGCFDTNNNQHFDLLVEGQESVNLLLKTIAKQINLLTLNT